MGIPVYFKTLIKDYENTILKKDKLTLCNSLFLDLNCAIHPCCQGETDETTTHGTLGKNKINFEEVLKKTLSILN